MSEIKVLDKGFVRLVDSMGTDSSIVQAARVSYGKGTKKVSEDEGLIRYLLRHGHTTPFEMVQFKFHIKAPIFVIRQWHRHRMWSYNEYSGRYSEMKDEFYVPDKSKVTKQNPNNKQGGTDDVVPFDDIFDVDLAGQSWSGLFQNQQMESRKNYEEFIASGMRKELARINLPLAQYTEMYASVDLHNLFHFLRLRMDSHAQYEIRVFADALAELIKPIVPVAYKAFEDYILGSVKLTSIEVKILQELIQLKPEGKPVGETEIRRTIGTYISNKREADEAYSKLTKFI